MVPEHDRRKLLLHLAMQIGGTSGDVVWAYGFDDHLRFLRSFVWEIIHPRSEMLFSGRSPGFQQARSGKSGLHHAGLELFGHLVLTVRASGRVADVQDDP